MIFRTGVALILLTTATSATAQTYPSAAQCSAFWLGRADYAAATTNLDGEEEARALGYAFQAAAVRMSEDSAAIKKSIADQRPLMLLLLDAFIYENDKQSREISERLTDGCGALASQLPETRDLM